MKIYDANQLISIKTSVHPNKIKVYNMKGLNISDLSFNEVTKGNNYTVIQLNRPKQINSDESAKDLYFLAISATRKAIKSDVILLFRAQDKLNIATIKLPITCCTTVDEICNDMATIMSDLMWSNDEIPMSLSEFSMIPAPQAIPYIYVKHWGQIWLCYLESEHKACLYGPKSDIEKTAQLFSNAREHNLDKLGKYFMLGHEFAVAVDYLILGKNFELKNSLVKINVLLQHLKIEYQFPIHQEGLEQLNVERFESIQTSIISKVPIYD
ncbi:MAG: hypothetical protein GF364_13080 [Candidatus Lokiarchaeota archaeon]|nr:hypothetical protein [Candidatus Lokiarchaeota archaeon]